MKQILPILLTISIIQQSWSQTIIKGQVLDVKNEPVPYANLILQDIWDGTATDEKGAFSFKSAHIGKAILSVSNLGYETQSIELELKGEIIELSIQLESAITELNTVVIAAGAFEAGDEKKGAVLRPLDIVQNPVASGDLYGALQTLPGVSIVGDETGIFVRGGEATETQTIIDGTLVRKPFFSEVPDIPSRGRFDPFLFKGTLFSTGGYSAEYGQALSSVLLLNTQDIPQNSNIGVGINLAGLSLSGTKVWKERTALIGSMGYTNLAPMHAIIPQNPDWKISPRGYGGAVGFRHKTEKGLFKSYMNYQSGSIALQWEDLDDPNANNYFRNDSRNFYWNASFKTILGEDWTLFTAFSLSNDHEEEQFNTFNFGENNFLTQARATLGRSLGTSIYWKFGGEVHQRTEKSTFEDFESKLNGPYTAFFTEVDITLHKKWAIRIGGRGEYDDLIGRSQIAPRTSLAFKTGNNSQVSLAYGQFYQTPGIDYLFFDQNLNFEKASHYILNYQWITEDRTFRLEAYQKDYDRLIKESFSNQYNNLGEGYARGVDLFWRDSKTINRLDYWLSYSYIDSERNYRDYPTSATPPFITKHTLSFVGRYSLNTFPLRIGAGYTFASGRPYDDPNTEGFLEEKTPAYHNISLNTSYLTTILGNFTVVYFSLRNPIGFEQVFGYRYSTDGSQRVAIIPSTNRSFFIGMFVSFQ